MAVKRRIPRYSTVEINGHIYYRTTVTDAEDNRISLYGKTREELYDKEIEEFEHIEIPKSKWLRFRINSQNSEDIQEISHKFYSEFLPSVKYNLKDLEKI